MRNTDGYTLADADRLLRKISDDFGFEMGDVDTEDETIVSSLTLTNNTTTPTTDVEIEMVVADTITEQKNEETPAIAPVDDKPIPVPVIDTNEHFGLDTTMLDRSKRFKKATLSAF